MTAPSSLSRSSRPLRVGFVIDALSVPAGGTEGQLLHLLRGLDRDRFQPRLYCLRSTPWLEQSFDLCPAEVLNLHLSAHPRLLGGVWKFSRRLRRDGVDVLQTHFRDANVVGVLAAALAGRPAVVSTRRGVPYWKSGADLLFLKGLNKRVTRFVANSRATRDRAVRDEGIDPARITVIYNGIEAERFAPRGEDHRKAVRDRLGVTESERAVVIVANLRPVKGIADFITAAARVREAAPGTRFFVVGQGDEEGALKALAARLGVGDAVTFLGARADVPRLLPAFDAGVLASHYESFSNAILEYLAAGLPVVVTDVGGAREVVREGEDGFIVPPEDPERMAEAVVTVLKRGRESRGAGFAGRGFEVPSMIAAHERVYASLCGTPPGDLRDPRPGPSAGREPPRTPS
jgi:glycosyltransferase involved in cell wall biosynthesis